MVLLQAYLIAFNILIKSKSAWAYQRKNKIQLPDSVITRMRANYQNMIENKLARKLNSGLAREQKTPAIFYPFYFFTV